MEPTSRCKCDECKSTEMVLQELDLVAPLMVATRERELMGTMV